DLALERRAVGFLEKIAQPLAEFIIGELAQLQTDRLPQQPIHRTGAGFERAQQQPQQQLHEAGRHGLISKRTGCLRKPKRQVWRSKISGRGEHRRPATTTRTGRPASTTRACWREMEYA